MQISQFEHACVRSTITTRRIRLLTVAALHHLDPLYICLLPLFRVTDGHTHEQGGRFAEITKFKLL